jgi:putative peptidoglycan lipid II flippase
MGGALWGMSLLLGPWLAAPFARWGALALLVAGGAAAYFAAAAALGAFRPADLRGALRRRG